MKTFTPEQIVGKLRQIKVLVGQGCPTLSRQANLSLGCYCEYERRCHRSILRELLAERGADIAWCRGLRRESGLRANGR